MELDAGAERVALAVDNAQAYERQQEIAGIIQEVLLPAPSVRFPGLTLAGRYRPSREVVVTFTRSFRWANAGLVWRSPTYRGRGFLRRRSPPEPDTSLKRSPSTRGPRARSWSG